MRRARAILSVGEHDDLIAFLAANPESGDVIPGTGGLRKLRWSAKGKGKSGGARVIYYYYNADHPVFALLIYGKGEQVDMSGEQKRTLVRYLETLKAELKKRKT